MVEGIHPEPLVVRAGQEGVAGTQAGAQHAEVLVALLLQPIQAATNIHHLSLIHILMWLYTCAIAELCPL